jgi:hypothetical protein
MRQWCIIIIGRGGVKKEKKKETKKAFLLVTLSITNPA